MLTEPFVPLFTHVAAATQPVEFRSLMAKPPEVPQPMRAPEPPAPPAAPVPTPVQPACEPKVSLQRDGERVTGIHIECSCGQVLDLACVYPA